MKDTVLVIPSIRKDSFERFIAEWRPTGLFDRVDLILMEDNPQRTFDLSDLMNHQGHPDAGTITHLCWQEIDTYGWADIIPRRSDTVRSYAYWWAWKKGYEYLMTMDDDCYPAEGYEQPDLIHKQMLTRTRWFNTLNNVRPRGFPYFNTGKRELHVNHGLWLGVLDYDAPQQLVTPTPEVYTHDNRIVPTGAYHPFCGMNVMWRRDAIPLSYHLLMGHAPTEAGGYKMKEVDGVRQPFLKKLPFDRFGDIWCGIIQKKICDHLGWGVSSGTPYIHHDRASNPFTNLRKEANGIEVNEWFWEKIDAIQLDGIGEMDHYSADARAACLYGQVGQHVAMFDGEHAAYWKRLGDAMVVWAQLFTADTGLSEYLVKTAERIDDMPF